MSSKYLSPIKRLGGIALIMFTFALVFPSLSNAIFSEETRKAVLINAVPFFSAFIGILLLFALLIVITAKRYNGKVPTRCHQSIERTLVAGILFSVFFLFQSFSIVPYRYGFLLLLASTLSFILWSHVIPASAKVSEDLPPLGSRQQIIGIIAALAIVVVMSLAIININAPKEPFGVRDRVWKSYSDDRKAEVASAALADFNSVETPFIVIFSLFPAVVLYFAAREVAAERRPVANLRTAPVAGRG